MAGRRFISAPFCFTSRFCLLFASSPAMRSSFLVPLRLLFLHFCCISCLHLSAFPARFRSISHSFLPNFRLLSGSFCVLHFRLISQHIFSFPASFPVRFQRVSGSILFPAHSCSFPADFWVLIQISGSFSSSFLNSFPAYFQLHVEMFMPGLLPRLFSFISAFALSTNFRFISASFLCISDAFCGLFRIYSQLISGAFPTAPFMSCSFPSLSFHCQLISGFRLLALHFFVSPFLAAGYQCPQTPSLQKPNSNAVGKKRDEAGEKGRNSLILRHARYTCLPIHETEACDPTNVLPAGVTIAHHSGRAVCNKEHGWKQRTGCKEAIRQSA